MNNRDRSDKSEQPEPKPNTANNPSTEAGSVAADTPSFWVSLIPLVVLVGVLFVVIRGFGADALSGASQTSLLIASSVCVAISLISKRRKWQQLEDAIVSNVKSVTTGIIILLLIGAIAGTWMLSGVVPSLICYGLQILHPRFLLVSTCIICAVVSVITGSSWTTVATIGVAFIGIGEAQGFSPGLVAGAIISGSYFGDKISPLSDTTVMASSVTDVPLFTHIRYMMITTVPSMTITLLIFLVVGLMHPVGDAVTADEVQQSLRSTFNVSGWLMIVPVVTCVLIALKLPSLITLFCSSIIAAVAMLIAQPQLLPDIAGGDAGVFMTGFKGFMVSIFGSTSVDTGFESLNSLVATRGMAGMMNTIWLVLCAMCFGGVMMGSGMLHSITSAFVRRIRRPVGAVSATVASGLMFNLTTGDQYLSIILTGRLFKELYEQQGLENRLLSRTTEDSVTVTSVLIPWNTCGMTQATVLGVPTLTFAPYCFFNIISPLMSIAVAASGYKIVRKIKGSVAE